MDIDTLFEHLSTDGGVGIEMSPGTYCAIPVPGQGHRSERDGGPEGLGSFPTLLPTHNLDPVYFGIFISGSDSNLLLEPEVGF